MEAHCGKWQIIKEETTGMAEFLTAVGVPKEAQAVYKDLDYTMETTKEGDGYKTVAVITGKETQSYTWKLGESFEYTSLDGTKPMCTVTMEGNTCVESYNLEKFKRQWKCVRTVDGDVMTSKTMVGEVTMVQKLKRV